MKRFEIGPNVATLQSIRLWRINVFVFLMLVASGLSAATPFVWNRTAPCPLGRFEAMGGAAEGKLYQFSGFYNTAIDIASGVTFHSVKVANVIEYDPLQNTWSELPPLPAAREAPVAGLVGNQIVVTCGALPIPMAHNQTWVALTAGSLPSPWADQDVGAVGGQGGASSSEYSSFLVAGSGIGIGSNADSFHYVYQPLNGDGQIVVKVATQENTSSSAAAGVMIRETTDPSAKHASILITPSKGVFFQRRFATGGATSQTILAGAGITAPYWMKLVRSGDTLTGYWSSTGTSWSPLGSDTISTDANVLIGVVVASGSSTVSSTSTFTDLDIVPESTSGAQPFQ